jgi:hypothetical protein
VREKRRVRDGGTTRDEWQETGQARYPTTCEVRRSRFLTQPDAVTASTPGTDGGIFAIESDEEDDGGNEKEERLHDDLLHGYRYL